MGKQVHTYPIHQRPDVEVLVDGTWYLGELRQWIDSDAHRTYDVSAPCPDRDPDRHISRRKGTPGDVNTGRTGTDPGQRRHNA